MWDLGIEHDFDEDNKPSMIYGVERLYDGSVNGLGAYGSFGSLLAEPERFTIMQYTGLKDKKRKEIYEGDIVKANKANTSQYGNPGYKGIGNSYEIIFFDGAYFLKGLIALNEWQIKHMDLEVIGNIYESPELLNQSL